MAEKKAKPQEPAGYCTTAVLANLFDITSQWVGELTKNGILRKHDTEVGPRYNVVEATRAYVKQLWEVDKRNMKCVIDGVDYMAPVRKALGK